MHTVNDISISHVSALQLIQLVQELATRQKLSIAACVVDKHGRIKAQLVMDHCALIADELVVRKARTALSGLSSADFANAVANLSSVRDSMLQLDSITLLAGGLPIIYQQQIIGAIAVGGASTEQDQQIAEEALRIFSA